MSLTSTPVSARIKMRPLRAAVLILFVLSIAVTAWSLLLPSGGTAHGGMPHSGIPLSHILHITHVAMITLTFLLIALYLYKSAEIASQTAYRELELRLTVDPGAGFINYLPVGVPVFNACAGALARKGIYVKSAEAMKNLADLRAVAVAGNSDSREGYSVTAATLASMGMELSDDVSACPVKLMLGPFDPQSVSKYDFVLTGDKITHVLAAVYISRIFISFSRRERILLCCAILAAISLLIFGHFTYAGAAVALWASSKILSIYHITKKTAQLSFASVSSYGTRRR